MKKLLKYYQYIGIALILPLVVGGLMLMFYTGLMTVLFYSEFRYNTTNPKDLLFVILFILSLLLLLLAIILGIIASTRFIQAKTLSKPERIISGMTLFNISWVTTTLLFTMLGIGLCITKLSDLYNINF